MAKGRIVRPEQTRGYKLPRVGLVKTGYKDERNYPRSCDYFIGKGKYQAMFDAAYPNKPKTIQIVFWEDNPATMCQERYEYRDKNGKLYASGDGEVFNVWNAKIEKYEEYTTAEHPDIMTKVDDKARNGKGWDVILTLRFIMPKIKDITGYWEYSTKGVASTIPAVRDMFDAMLNGRGSVKGVIFDLNVEFAKSQKPGVKSRYPVVSLIPNQSKENINAIKGGMMHIDEQQKSLEAG